MKYFIRNQEYAFGIDLSRYNASADMKSQPNFDAICRHEPKVDFIGLRTGQSWGYTDPAFTSFYVQAEAARLCILPYHVIFPAEPALRQVAAFLKILDGIDIAQLRLVLDVELDHGQTRMVITNTLARCLEQLKMETGRYPIVYSRASWIERYLLLSELPEVDWWLAQYYFRKPFPEFTYEYPCPPALPKGLNRWLIHQTAERGPSIGGPGTYMDYNRWNGGRESLLAYFGRSAADSPRSCPFDGLACPRASAARWQNLRPVPGLMPAFPKGEAV
ncbi:MAG: glycoside hydrolase family 25 protein [Anaerolineaceae bacterium]|nr:glycoside hydrolase family 25 protein [Anaerolineaceae bacterium]